MNTRKRTSVDGLVARRLGITGKMGRDGLESAQFAALKHCLRHAIAQSSLYKERFAGIDPGSLNRYSDLKTIPFLTRADILEAGHRLLTVSQSQVARVVTLQTSGSTGMPKRFYFSQKDLDATIDFFLHGMRSLVGAGDRVMVLLPFEQPASVGELLIMALTEGGIPAQGMWPPASGKAMVETIREQCITSIVGLPQHLLAVSKVVTYGQIQSMLLCSDYASPALRHQIEKISGCETFVHYGATESGLGGAVECFMHAGCHIRESDLLIEIVNPQTGQPCGDGQPGEIVMTTLGREAMPLIRYRTGDIASIDRTTCLCGGVTARLKEIRGRLEGCQLASGAWLYSQDVDDLLYQVTGLLDYRLRLDHNRVDHLHLEYIASPESGSLTDELQRRLNRLPEIRDNLVGGDLVFGVFQRLECFTATHTLKRTIIDQRGEGYVNAAYIR